MDVKVYDASGAVFDERELSLSELPQIPDWFNEGLLDCAGTCNDKPNIRVVSGLDPEIQEFVGGRWWRKYAFREHRINEYSVLHKPDGSKKILSPKESEVLTKSKKQLGIIVPVVERKVIEYGVPRYFIEYYKPPEYYGTEEAWDIIRYDEDSEGNKVDLMGEFPTEGRYETWFCIEEPVIRDEVVVKTTFRELDEIVLELIKDKVNKIKNKTVAEQHLENRKEIDADYIKHQNNMKEDIKDIVKARINRLVQ